MIHVPGLKLFIFSHEMHDYYFVGSAYLISHAFSCTTIYSCICISSAYGLSAGIYFKIYNVTRLAYFLLHSHFISQHMEMKPLKGGLTTPPRGGDSTILTLDWRLDSALYLVASIYSRIHDNTLQVPWVGEKNKNSRILKIDLQHITKWRKMAKFEHLIGESQWRRGDFTVFQGFGGEFRKSTSK